MDRERSSALDAAVDRYAPEYPWTGSIKRVLIGGLIMWLIAVVAYGIPFFIRYTNVRHTEIVATQNGHYNHLMRMVAGVDPSNGQDELTQLAVLLRQLRGPGYPNEVALRSYTVAPYQFPDLPAILGSQVTTQVNPKTNYGHFTDQFLGDVVEAVPGQVSQLLLPTTNIRSWGNFQWRYAIKDSAGFMVGLGINCSVLLGVERRRKIRARREFEQSLTDEDYKVLELVVLILENRSKPGFGRDLDKADKLFRLVRSQHSDSSPSSRDIDIELDQLRAIYTD